MYYTLAGAKQHLYAGINILLRSVPLVNHCEEHMQESPYTHVGSL